MTVVGAFTVVNYQNCAPAGKLGAVAGDGGDVGVINPVTTKGAVAFIENDVAVQSPAKSASVRGVCREDQVGATLGWILRDAQGNFVSEGNVDCDESGFNVELAPTLAGLECGESYSLYARLGVDESTPVSINHDCQ